MSICASATAAPMTSRALCGPNVRIRCRLSNSAPTSPSSSSSAIAAGITSAPQRPSADCDFEPPSVRGVVSVSVSDAAAATAVVAAKLCVCTVVYPGLSPSLPPSSPAPPAPPPPPLPPPVSPESAPASLSVSEPSTSASRSLDEHSYEGGHAYLPD